MTLEIKPGYAAMEARNVAELPEGDGWQYEPKWDGFRCLAFRDGAKIVLQSKAGQPLARYFPDLVEQLEMLGARQFVLDGEIVIPVRGRLSFDDLLMRIHPAASRVERLAREFPATYIVFDLLADEKGKSLVKLPLSRRRELLEGFASKWLTSAERIRLSPATTDIAVARKWYGDTGGNLDGIIAKRADMDYRSGLRDGMQKFKHRRTADCVVGGIREGRGRAKGIGSLLLGLYNAEGLLHHVGFTSSFTPETRRQAQRLVAPLRGGKGFTGRAPGGPSRWSKRGSDEWIPLEPKLVVEVEYDHVSGQRFRHGTKLLRFRPDKQPKQCTMDQIEQHGGAMLKLLEKASFDASPTRRKRAARKGTAPAKARRSRAKPKRAVRPDAPPKRKRVRQSR